MPDDKNDTTGFARVDLQRTTVALRESDADTITQTQEETGSSYGFVRLRPRLIYLGSPENGFVGAGTAFSLADFDRVVFGRARSKARGVVSSESAKGLQIAIPLPWVSGVHAQLESHLDGEKRKFRLSDLKSSNGTLVEGRLIDGSARMRDRTVFEVGRSFWMLAEAGGSVDRRARTLETAATAHPDLCGAFKTLSRLADSDIPIVIVGETGAGKEYVARCVHAQSGRRGEFVRYNVSAAPPDQALVGAEGQPVLEAAKDGTIYLHELGDLTPAGQAQLLEMLPAIEHAGVRVISGLSHDPRRMVDDGRFRSDLYARLSGFEMELPPLRDRREDTGMLLAAFMAEAPDCPPLTAGGYRRILAYPWPFNIRELHHVLRAASLVVAEGESIDASVVDSVMPRVDPSTTTPDSIQAVRDTLVERLRAYSGDTEAVAQSLACAQEDVHGWLDRFEIAPADYLRWS